jgi:hypothetical protein
MLADPIISELVAESTDSGEAYRNALRLEISLNFQRLRALLATVNHLMETYNRSASSSKA